MDTYVVLEGESLQGVALKTGVRASQLKAMNKLYSDSLYPGQRLSLRNPHYIPPPPLPSTPMTPIPSSSSSSPLQAVSPAVPAPSREAFDFQADFSSANSSPPPFVPSSPPQPPQQPAYSFFDFDPFGNSQSQQPEPSHDEPDFLSESTPSKRSHRSPSFQDTFFSLLSTVIGSHPSHDDRSNNNINSGGSPPSKRNSSEEDLTTPSWHEVLSFPNLLNLSRDKEEEEKEDEDIRRAALERDRINSTNLNHPSIAPSTMGPDSWAPSPSLIGGPSSILSSAQIDLLHRQLPIILQFDAWHLLYSVLENGADITSFYRLAGTTRYSLIIIETALGDVFGGFASSSWQTNKEFCKLLFSDVVSMVHTPKYIFILRRWNG